VSPVGAFVERLVSWQVRRPHAPLALVAAVTAIFAWQASKLTLRTRYDALLPDDAPSVQELRRVEQRAAASQTVLIVLEGGDRRALRRLGDAIVPALLALGPGVVSSAEDGPHDARAFLAPRAGLFLERAELEKLERDIEARWDYEVSHASGFALDDEEPPPALAWSELEKRLRDPRSLSGPLSASVRDPRSRSGPLSASVRDPADDRGIERFPDGYYERADGRALVVVARSPLAGGDLERIGAALRDIRAAVDRVRASAPELAAVTVSYAGDMPTGFREYGVISADLLSVGATGVGLVLAVVVLYFLRARAALVMAVTIAVGLTWTFGLTRIAIGHLNVATAFLVSIVAGNGINVGILYQARYFEERRRGLDPPAAARVAVDATWRATAIAALAAAASYGSLLVTDFRAFRDFGFIAASGMIICWIVKTLMVAPLLVLLDRGPGRPGRGWLGRHEMAYGRVFAWLVPKAPAAIAVLGITVAVAGAVSAARFVWRDPMEYDLRKTETDHSQTADLHHAWAVAHDVLGASQGALAIATDSADEAVALADALRARWRAAPAAEKPFVAVHALGDLVAADQEAKLPTLHAIGERLERAHVRGFVTEDDWTRIREVLPPADLQPYGLADVPASVAGRFTDTSGVRGALVFIESDPGAADDLRTLVRFADAFRETRLPSGKTVHGSGSAVILADMLRAVVRDVPRALSLSLALTLATVFVTFRRGPYLAAVLFAFAVGCGGVACFLFVADVKINFLNFSALPITFGIGVDYAVNVAQRHQADGGTDVLRVLRTSGGAVVLCSLTTMLGYLALLGSHNGAIRGLGAIAAVGELSCLLAAVLVLPSLWWLLERNPHPRGLSWALDLFRLPHPPTP
jgi:predicted RND superfamily exporter protein